MLGQICESLRNAEIMSDIYHSQMSGKAREESHRSFIRDELQVMVAIVAFGMGIDKPNIRCVIHYGCPKSLETYYQESGHCGRDGLTSICWLYYARSDFAKVDFYCAEAQSENQKKAIMEFHGVKLEICEILLLLNVKDSLRQRQKLYHKLFDIRMKLARDDGTAPYAICGDQTIKKIAKIRPSTRARLANIDGVNQHLVKKYGDNFLQNISHLSQELNLPLDEGTILTDTAECPISQRKLTAITMKEYPNSQKILALAKFSAWQIRQAGLSLQEIANSPEKSAPIKEQTVIVYILEAARERFETTEIVLQIHSAITKIGSRDRFKPWDTG